MVRLVPSEPFRVLSVRTLCVRGQWQPFTTRRATCGAVPLLATGLSYPLDVARPVEDLPDDQVLVIIDEDEPVGTFDEWRALLAGDELSALNADAAEILRDIREHGER